MNFLLFIAIAVLSVVIGLVLWADRKSYATHENGIILITGASTGIGKHAAEHMARNHPFVILAGVRKESDAEYIRKLGLANLRPIIIDVAVHDSCVRAVEEIAVMIETENLPLIAVVNNAGIASFIPVEFHKMENARNIFETNVFGVLDLTQLTLPMLRKSAGRIINISSMAGVVSAPKNGVYSASKFALESISDALRNELNQFGISVSVIQPAYVKTTIAATTTASSKKMFADDSVKQEMLSLYAPFYSPKAQAKQAMEIELASEPIVVTVAIEDALVSATPKTRYQVANAVGVPAQVLGWVLWLLSDRLRDLMLMNV